MTLEHASAALRGRSNILVYTGAGISTESGIPDFRGPNGLWTKVDPEDFTIDRYLNSVERRVSGWRMHAKGELWGARSTVAPNVAHLSVTQLWNAGRSVGVITQNVDGLHLEAGLTPDALSEIHGNVRRSVCVGCGASDEIETVLQRVDAGESDPHCLECGGILKSATVMFGQMLPATAVARAAEFADDADAVLVIGSTMSVYPATGFALEPVRRGAPLVIINLGATDHDHVATVKLDMPAGEATRQLVNSLIN